MFRSNCLFSRFLLFTAGLSVALNCVPCAARIPISLNNDLLLDFRCSSYPSKMSLMAFLEHEGLHLFDRPSLAPTIKDGIAIAAYDARRLLYIYGPESSTQLYDLMLISSPPTQHDDALESRISKFIEQRLNCKVIYVRRGENPGSLLWLFDQQLKQLQEEEKAAICSNSKSAPEAKECS